MFKNLVKSENYIGNRTYYLAFLIIYDTEYFGVFSNFYDYGSQCLEEEVVKNLESFLLKNNITTLNSCVENKDVITSYLLELVTD